MSRDDIEDDSQSEEDAFYEADYDEDTIDYELDTDDLLADDAGPSSASSRHWETIMPDEAPLPNLDPDFELDADGDFGATAAADTEPPWADQDVDSEAEAQDGHEPWPLGLIGAAILALVLLTAGGYGVVQQRAAMKEQIRELQAELGTTASNQEVAVSRQAQRALDARNSDLQLRINALELENKNLQTEIVGLETKLASAEQTKAAAPKPAPVVSKPAPAISKPAPVVEARQKVAATKVPPVANGRTWFVNFGSYAQESTARNWASKLKVDEGELIVAPGHKGVTRFYRVRVVGLPSRAIAEKIANQLETTYSLPKLWVGQQ